MFFRFGLAIALVALAIYWFQVRMRDEDIVACNKLIQESTALRSRHALEESPAYQQRRGVQKEIWSENETRHFQIQSEESELTLNKNGVIEQLKNIRGQLEGEFGLSADEGTYQFPSRQFVAEKNCHLVQGENWIDGTKIHLDIAKEIVTYDNPKGHLSSIDFTANTLMWHKKEGKLYLNHQVHIEQVDQFVLIADQGTVILTEMNPTLLILEGNVRLISSHIQDKESHAIADTLTYNPNDKTLLFTAAKKVLFWQEGFSLSAPEILIRQNQTVEGHGDVHFAFDLEEQNYIDELFKQYL